MNASFNTYLIIFLLNFLEGSVVTFGAGVSSIAMGVNYYVALGVLIIADIISDVFYYFLGRFSFTIFDSKYAKFIGVNNSRLGLIKGYYDRHGKITLFLAKMSDILAVPAIILAGAIKMPIATFLMISIATSIVKASALYTAGYLLSNSISIQGITKTMYLLSGICILIITTLMFRYFYVKIKVDETKYKK